MKTLSPFINTVYVYCTDFIINLANLLGWSYYEVNALIFCLLYPLILMSLFIKSKIADYIN